MENDFEIESMNDSKNMDDLRLRFLQVTRNIFTSSQPSDVKQKYRIISENKFREMKNIIENEIK